MMKIKLDIKLLGALMLCALTACTQPDFEERPLAPEPPTPEQPDPGVTTGHVTLTPEWGSISMPAGLRVYLYPSSGAVVAKDCPATGFNSDLEAGTYRLLAVNTDTQGVELTGMDSYATAAVKLLAGTGRASTVVGQPGSVYALALPELVVEKEKTLTRTLPVASLVRSVKLDFTFSDASRVRSLAGSLPGVCASVLLATGQPTDAAKAAAPTTEAGFTASLANGAGTAVISLLDLLNPEGDTAYRNLLKLTLVTTSNQTSELDADLTTALTEAFAGNGGSLPASLVLNVNITVPALPGTNGSATVIGWNTGGDVDGEL